MERGDKLDHVKRKRDQGSYHVQKKQKNDTNPPEEDGETKHTCSTHITKKPPDKP
jgi:hypothetical protein